MPRLISASAQLLAEPGLRRVQSVGRLRLLQAPVPLQLEQAGKHPVEQLEQVAADDHPASDVAIRGTAATAARGSAR